MKKPREFWIKNMEIVEINEAVFYKASNEDMIRAGFVLVREVIGSPTDEQIEEAGRYNLFTEDGGEDSDVTADWMAGARWAIAKLTGGSK